MGSRIERGEREEEECGGLFSWVISIVSFEMVSVRLYVPESKTPWVPPCPYYEHKRCMMFLLKII